MDARSQLGSLHFSQTSAGMTPTRMRTANAAGPEWWFGLALGLGGAVGSVVGARLQPRLPVEWLRGVLAIAALSAGIRLVVG